MKVQTLVTISGGKDKNGKTVFVPPGVVELPDDEAQRLIRLGMAKTIAQAEADAAASAGKVSVTNEKGPRIINVHEGAPVVDPEPAAKTGKRNRRADTSDQGE